MAITTGTRLKHRKSGKMYVVTLAKPGYTLVCREREDGTVNHSIYRAIYATGSGRGGRIESYQVEA